MPATRMMAAGWAIAASESSRSVIRRILHFGKALAICRSHFFVRLGLPTPARPAQTSGDLAMVRCWLRAWRIAPLVRARRMRRQAYAKGIGWAGAGGGADLAGGVDQDAFGFGAAAVEAQDEAHGERICDCCGLCGEGCGECEVGGGVQGRSLFSLERLMSRRAASHKARRGRVLRTWDAECCARTRSATGGYEWVALSLNPHP